MRRGTWSRVFRRGVDFIPMKLCGVPSCLALFRSVAEKRKKRNRRRRRRRRCRAPQGASGCFAFGASSESVLRIILTFVLRTPAIIFLTHGTRKLKVPTNIVYAPSCVRPTLPALALLSRAPCFPSSSYSALRAVRLRGAFFRCGPPARVGALEGSWCTVRQCARPGEE